ncbi:unnamed protein product [Brassica rapa]|uniref:Uncharacterized protein n=2 Tax=Brassica TaxID=3705 RepID=A0A3P6AKW1_BRACM|nr:unnamed protein product [Brassica napus]CAG7895538.1 unnamed protein product [Brassica rapa]CDY67071.1 BnaUnng01860D [Brassica napus]VDC92127.1 unnamed protein product [Brassica rapa]
MSSSSFPTSSASSSSAASSLAAKAIRASLVHRDSSLFSAYSSPPVPTPPKDPPQHLPQSPTTRMDHNNMPSSAASGTKEAGRKTENPSLQRSLDAITSSFNYIGTAVEASFWFWRVLQLWRRLLQGSFKKHIQADLEIQLKASRDGACSVSFHRMSVITLYL